MTETVMLDSEFEVEITTLPPYYFDFILDAIPLPDYPKIKYKNVAGDVFELEYKPPEVPPSEDDEELLLYRRWLDVEARRVAVLESRKRAKVDFVLSNCVHVVDGPYLFQEADWVIELEGGLSHHGYSVPKDLPSRRLAFIKGKVVTSLADWELVRDKATYAEVTFEGIISAMAGFGMNWDGAPLNKAMEGMEASRLSHDIRLWESETAEACGLPFDERWYSIPVLTRCYMVASYVGRKWSAALLEEDAVRRARAKGAK